MADGSSTSGSPERDSKQDPDKNGKDGNLPPESDGLIERLA